MKARLDDFDGLRRVTFNAVVALEPRCHCAPRGRAWRQFHRARGSRGSAFALMSVIRTVQIVSQKRTSPVSIVALFESLVASLWRLRKLIVPMLGRFVATDRGFAKARRTLSGRQVGPW